MKSLANAAISRVQGAPRLRRLALWGLVGLGLGAVGCDEQVLNPMADRQPRARAYRESAFYANGLTMQAPPAGTVPRERKVMNVALTSGTMGPTGKFAPNGEELRGYVTKIPLPVTAELMALGRKRWDITCGTCHGPAADGKSIVGSQMALRPPPSLVTTNYINKPVGYIFEVATKGFGMMASYEAELTVEERWAVVAYLRALQRSQAAPLDAAPPAERARLEQEAP